MSGFGMAMRIGTELVAALIVGVGIGFFLDKWLGTAPWFLVVFFFLGAGAGILNVYRMTAGLGSDPEDGRTQNKVTNGPGGADDGNQHRDG
jgi:ATP synthase protein I